MDRALAEHQFALQEQGGDDDERYAKTKEWNMIIDAELEERWQRALRLRQERQRE